MRKIALMFTIIFSSATLPTGLAHAGVTETVDNRYYQISPRTPWDIKQELKRNSPIRTPGGSFNGRTDWKIDWSYQTTGDTSSCRIHDVKVHVNVTYILPALSEYVTDPATIEAFERFNMALVAHERNHGKHGLQAASEVDEALSSIPPQRDCNAVSQMANRLSQEIVNKYVYKDREYDRVTSNGMTEGAWLR